MAISLTEAAAKQVRSHLGRSSNAVGLRLGVKATGCNGYSYVLDLVDSVADNDFVFESHEVKIIVDPKSLELVDGTELDFVKDGLNEVFRFKNPNISGECGCGESFNV